MATIDVKDAANSTVPVELPNANGRQPATGSRPVALSDEDLAAIAAIVAALAPPTTSASVGQDMSALYNGVTAVAPGFLPFSASTSGNNTLLAAQTGKKIRVFAFWLNSAGAVNAKFQSGASGTDISKLIYMPAAGNGIVVNFSPTGWFETASNVLLNLNLSAAVAVDGGLIYGLV